MSPITKEDVDWLRTPESAKKGFTESEIEFFETLWQRTCRLESRIKLAFADVILDDGVGLFEADARDMCIDPAAPERARVKDERVSWQAITQDDIYRYDSALSFTDAKGFRFLVPAFMLSDLRSACDDAALVRLCGIQDDPYGQCSELNEAQLEVIIEFLELYLNVSECSTYHSYITESVAAFWRPLLHQKTKAERPPGDL